MRKRTSVFAQKEPIGMENGVKITGAKEGKFGTEPNAFVRLDIISMVFYVCSV